jgi:hypothetical protein
MAKATCPDWGLLAFNFNAAYCAVCPDDKSLGILAMVA